MGGGVGDQVRLRQGVSYIAFLDVIGIEQPPFRSSTAVSAQSGSTYAGGMCFGRNAPDTPFSPITNVDMPFVARFSTIPASVVPEPSTGMLAGTGLLVLGLASARRRARG